MRLTDPEIRAVTDRCLDAVEAGADPDWYDVAKHALSRIAASRPTFTTDDVWRFINRFGSSVPATPEPRAMGAVMRWGRRANLCSPMEEWTPSERKECHGRVIRVWRSEVDR